MEQTYKRIRVSRTQTVDEHRLVMAEKLGRALTSEEIVHHRNENKRDNEPDNLELTNRPEHARTHLIGTHRSEETKRRISVAMKGKALPHWAVLSDEKVRAIREMRSSGVGPSATALAFDVHKCTVIDIAKGRRYGHVK